MAQKQFRVYYWDDLTLVYVEAPDYVQEFTPVNFSNAPESNVSIYKLTEGRTVVHIPRYPEGLDTKTLNFIKCSFDTFLWWKGKKGAKVKLTFKHYITMNQYKQPCRYRMESFQCIVSLVKPVYRLKTLPQMIDLELTFIKLGESTIGDVTPPYPDPCP